jgi:hypothetical protein
LAEEGAVQVNVPTVLYVVIEVFALFPIKFDKPIAPDAGISATPDVNAPVE